MELNTVVHGDCLDVMKSFPDSSVDMVLTSPPYDELRSYNGSLDWGAHIWEPIIQELFRVLKEGGIVVWIVNDATIKGSETGTSFKQALYFKEVGFNIHDTMIWNKGGFSAVGALKTRYAPVFEYMFVFAKGNLKTFNPLKDRKNKHGGKLASGTIRQVDGSFKPMSKTMIINDYGQRFNIWEQGPQRQRGGHPAPFPETLVHDHIVSWSNEGDVVLDPFAGSGTVGKVAKDLGRNYILIEKDLGYVNSITERLECPEYVQLEG